MPHDFVAVSLGHQNGGRLSRLFFVVVSAVVLKSFQAWRCPCAFSQGGRRCRGIGLDYFFVPYGLWFVGFKETPRS